MLSSKAKKRAASASKPAEGSKQHPPSLDALLAARDWAGAVTLLQFRRQGSAAARGDTQLAEWLAYALFHAGEHDKALSIYRELLQQADPNPQYHTYAGACCYCMGAYEQAEEAVLKGPRCPLATRVLFHCAHARGDDDALMAHHTQLTNSLEDQLSLAALHFNQAQYQEATDIYKSLLLDHRDLLALNVYVALCYAKLDYFDVSSDVLQHYLTAFPASPSAANLAACNAFRLQDGAAAEAKLRRLADATAGRHAEHDLIRHNLVAFQGGKNALQVLPALGDEPPEARLNLAIHRLRSGALDAAEALLSGVDPATPHEFILKGIVHLLQGQASGSADALRLAQQHFHAVGSSPAECDTIPGRQAMASALFLLRQFDDVLVFLDSIKSYFASDDDFNWNHGLSLAAAGRYREADGALEAVQKPSLRADPVYMRWRTRCLIFTGRAAAAWELVAGAQAEGRPCACGEAGAGLLQQLGDDCYRVGAFFYAAKAFDALERLDPSSPALFEAKRGAVAGVFQAVVAGKEDPELLGEVLEMLEASGTGGGGRAANSSSAAAALALQVEQISRAMVHWAQTHGVVL